MSKLFFKLKIKQLLILINYLIYKKQKLSEQLNFNEF